MGPEYVAAFEAAAPYIFGAGTAATMYGQDQQAKEKRTILNRALDQTDQDQQKAVAQTVDQAQSLSGDSRLQQMKAAEAANFDRTQADLKGAGADLIDTSQPGDAGGSSAFATAKAARAGEENARMTAVARELAKVRSSGDVQTAQGYKLARLAEGLGSMWNSAKTRGVAAQRDAEDVGMGGIGQLGQLAMIVGGAGMGGGGAAGAGSAVGTDLTGATVASGAVGGDAVGYGAAPSMFTAAPKRKPVYSWMGR